MSRKEITGKVFDLAFGVDRVNGAFVQLWEKPAEDQDGVLLNVDSRGIRVDEEKKELLPPSLQRFLFNLEKRFLLWKETSKGGQPNIDEQVVIDLTKHAGGFPDVTKEVYKIFGDDL